MKTTPKMKFSEAFLNVINIKDNYNNYSGRARRSEFWYTTLICVAITTAFDCYLYYTWGESNTTNLVSLLVATYFGFPNYTCLCRRMHDIGYSSLLPGVTQTVGLAAFIFYLLSDNEAMNTAYIVFTVITLLLFGYNLVLCTKDSDKGKNRYGLSDKYVYTADDPEVMDRLFDEYGGDLSDEHDMQKEIVLWKNKRAVITLNIKLFGK